MQFDFEHLSRSERYKLMASVITPRPIAWVTTLNPAGMLNAAPFSFFNMFGDDPPIVALGIMQRAGGQLKDTAANIRSGKAFVVNIAGEAQAVAMNDTSIDAPEGTDEAALFNVEVLPSERVAPPRIASVPASFECRLQQIVEVSETQSIVIGEVVYGHVRDEFIVDADKMRLNVDAMRLIGRMHGPGYYARTTDLFDLRRPVWPLDRD
ncbi:flavin reductase family protein [Sphingomonas crocodyli]|uniref:Flavin reductase family protein n=1 Tax=Sphingomonas crocodyli TaxID=1979270 RepID=A0A437M7E6_9SPHN|nr:flavin reductase family protein [Sphingomonas crocodyli]RVT93533.1 flavin reductase family protein [Sphingomonas crocodyli]